MLIVRNNGIFTAFSLVLELKNQRRNHMKAKNLTSVLLIIASLVFASCSSEPYVSHGDINLRFTSNNAKTLAPVGGDYALLEIESYDYILETPDRHYIKGVDQQDRVTFNNMVIGSYTITVYGKNSAGTVIAEGTKTFTVNRGTNNVEVTLASLTGTGSLSISFVWDPDRAGEVTYEAKLKNAKTGEEIILIDDQYNHLDGMIAFEKDNLAAGSYTLTLKLLAGGKLIAGHVEAVRIGSGTLTTSEGNYISIEIGSEVMILTMNVKDMTGLPIVGSISSSDGTLQSNGLPETVTLSYQVTTWNGEGSEAEAGISVEWFADSVSIGSGNNLSYTPVKDITSITAVFYQEAYEGSIGSISKTLEYAVLPSAAGFGEYTP